jgi:hypothetical protein
VSERSAIHEHLPAGDPPWGFAQHITITGGGLTLDGLTGTVSGSGVYPAPWVEIERPGRPPLVVLLGPGMLIERAPQADDEIHPGLR